MNRNFSKIPRLGRLELESTRKNGFRFNAVEISAENFLSKWPTVREILARR